MIEQTLSDNAEEIIDPTDWEAMDKEMVAALVGISQDYGVEIVEVTFVNDEEAGLTVSEERISKR